MHVTYEFRKKVTFLEIDEEQSSRASNRILSRIDHRIAQLKQEQEIIGHICAQLTLFLRVNSISPTNEDVIAYINHFIREENEKLNAGDNNKEIIKGLEKLAQEYQNEINLLKSNIDANLENNGVPSIDDIYIYKWQLFDLPITGKYIEEQVNSLNSNQIDMIQQREQHVQLPQNAQYSATMKKLQNVLS